MSGFQCSKSISRIFAIRKYHIKYHTKEGVI